MVETIFQQKVVRENGDIVEMRILSVPEGHAHPEGVRYSLVYIREGKRMVGYDNYEHKSHHKHIQGIELPYLFRNVEQLIADFRKDVKTVLGEEL